MRKYTAVWSGSIDCWLELILTKKNTFQHYDFLIREFLFEELLKNILHLCLNTQGRQFFLSRGSTFTRLESSVELSLW